MKTMLKKCFAVLLASLLVSQSLVMPIYAEANAEPPAQCPREELSRWIVGTTAILNIRNGVHYRRFEGERIERDQREELFEAIPWLQDFYDQDPDWIGTIIEDVIDTRPDVLDDREIARRGLAGSWNTHSADDLRERIAGLMAGRGHSQRFEETFATFSTALNVFSELDEVAGLNEELVLERFLMGIEQSTDVLTAERVANILYLGEKWGDLGIIGWDLVRVGTLICMGYAAEFIDREEAFRLMEPASNMLKMHFSSWDEAIDNYIDGFTYWANHGNRSIASVRLEATQRRLAFHRLRLDYLVQDNEHLSPFNDFFFDRTPIVNLQRTILPAPEMLRGYWLYTSADASVEFYFGQDGRTALAAHYYSSDTRLKLTGSYRFDEDGMLQISYYRIDRGNGLVPLEDQNLAQSVDFYFMSDDGNRFILIRPINGRHFEYERSEGELIAQFR